jgi:hypothetical protein
MVKMMKTRHQLHISLVVLITALLGILQGCVTPQVADNKIAAQQDPLTHDITSTLTYKNPYMGNASNLANLFSSLPLSNTDRSFQLYPDTLTAEVNYKETVMNIGEEKVNRALIYNATAVFALIDNLDAIRFDFAGESYKATRSDVEKWYGVDVSTLVDKGSWEKLVQSKLHDPEYVLRCIKNIMQNTN